MAGRKSSGSNLDFNKSLFKNSVVYNIKTQYRRSLDEATPENS